MEDGRSIIGDQHCNGQGNHLGSAVSLVQNQRLAYKLVDVIDLEEILRKMASVNNLQTLSLLYMKGQEDGMVGTCKI